MQFVFSHLQNLVSLVTAGLVLLLLAANSYPFQPRGALLLFSWVMTLSVVGITMFVFFQMSRNKVLSLLSGSTPGAVTFSRELVTRVLIHGLLPLVALFGVQFPETVRQVLVWFNLAEGGR